MGGGILPAAAATATAWPGKAGRHRGSMIICWMSIFLFTVFWISSSLVLLLQMPPLYAADSSNSIFDFLNKMPPHFAANSNHNVERLLLSSSSLTDAKVAVAVASFRKYKKGQNKNSSTILLGDGDGKDTTTTDEKTNKRINDDAIVSSDNLPPVISVKQDETSSSSSTSGSNPEYAYAFVVGGCNPDKPSYRFYLYNILVSARILHEQGSVADVVVFVQMSWASNRTTLPADEEGWLQEMNIRVHYIQPVEDETFYRIVLHKFLILGLTEYKRVILMDGDIMPIANLDYLFQMSLAGTLKENFIYQGSMEPSNAGFFMLTPDSAALNEIDAIIQRRAENARRLPHPYFDEVEGWGHVIEPPDQWETKSTSGTRWNFWCAFADQGLLYYWTKYVRKSVSILKPKGIVDNWGPDPDSAYGVKLEKRLLNAWDGTAPSQCWGKNGYCNLGPPFSHFVHFTGRSKPWWHPPTHVHAMTEENSKTSPESIWFWHLMQLDEQFQLHLNFSTWGAGNSKESGPLLGMHSALGQAKRVDGLDWSWKTSARVNPALQSLSRQ